MSELDTQVRELLEAGDEAGAVTRIVSELAPRMLGFLNGVLLDRDASHEVWAVACGQIWAAIEGFEGRSSVETWVYAIVRRACAGYLRAPHRRRERLVADLEPVAEPRSPTPPWKQTPIKDAARELRERLEPHERELLILRVDRRMSWRTLAEMELGEEVDEAALKKREAALRKRFERVKEKLATIAREAGILP